MQGLALLLVAWAALLRPAALPLGIRDYDFVRLVSTPQPVDHQPAPLRVLEPPLLAQSPNALHVPPESKKPPEEPVVAPKVEPAQNIAPVLAAAPVIPRELVKTNVFSEGSSAPPTIAASPQQVQTGGFGDPNGVPASPANGRPVNIAQVGSYDLPSGAGFGNGTGGPQGRRGVVASAGFGNRVATGDGSGRVNGSRGTVRQGGFGDSEPASLTPHAKPAVLAPAVVPAEIIFKPTPAYTEEARKLRIEGEVLLEVVFESAGTIRVVRIVRGLGHGLDESAVQAAQQIRFKPALRDGQPSDFNGVLHIMFQLS
jgi:TonB family protein